MPIDFRSTESRTHRILIVNAALVERSEGAGASDVRRADVLRTGVLDARRDIVASLRPDADLPERVAQLQPDMIIVDAPFNVCDVLRHIVAANEREPRPIVLFTEDRCAGSMDAAMAAGVSAYVVSGLQAERIAPVMEVALARFRREQKLLADLDAARNKLAERKMIDRAKGLLMNRGRLSEDQAYQKLRSMAMNKNLKLAEIAQRILDVEDLLG